MSESIEIIIFSVVFIYVSVYVIYMYNAWYKEKKIREKEELFKQLTKNEFYIELYFMVLKYNPDYKSKRDYNAYNEAKKLFKTNSQFRLECYNEGIRPRMLEIIKKLD